MDYLWLLVYFTLMFIFLVLGKFWKIPFLMERRQFLKKTSSIGYLLTWLILFILPAYTVGILSVGTYHDVLLSGSELQRVLVASDFADSKHWTISSDGSFEFIGQDKEFYQSLVTSGLDSIIFFSLIGLTTVIVGLKNPKNETIHNRVDYLLSGEGVDAEARDKAVKKIEKLGCYNESMDTNLVVEAVDNKNDILRITVNYRARIRNMFKRESYVDNDTTCDMEIEHDCDKDTLAQVQHIRVDGEDKLERIQSFEEKGKHSTKPIKLEIPPNKSVNYESQQWMWEKFGNPYYFGVKRFTKNLVIKISNASNSGRVQARAIKGKYDSVNAATKLSFDNWEDIGNTSIRIYQGAMDEMQELKVEFRFIDDSTNTA